MTLRGIVLAVAAAILLLAIGGALYDSGTWPAVFFLAVLVAALAIERRRYGAAHTEVPGAGWQETSEQFVDDATGKLVRVWYHAETGARRYVEIKRS